MRSVLLSSEKQTWETPQGFFKKLDDEFGFTLDCAADCFNTKCESFLDESKNALSVPWGEVNWVNPPFGDKRYPVRAWVKKAHEESLLGKTVVMLLPINKCDQRWFSEIAIPFAEIRFVVGRVQFVGTTSSNTQGSMILHFGPNVTPGRIRSFVWRG